MCMHVQCICSACAVNSLARARAPPRCTFPARRHPGAARAAPACATQHKKPAEQEQEQACTCTCT
eukprot:scaffold143702_cov115-Phaeocystis_antarctica.AAC.3